MDRCKLGDRIWLAFAFDVFTNLVFLVIVARWCKTPGLASKVARRVDAPRRVAGLALQQAFESLRESFAYLARAKQRPLLYLLIGGVLVEVVRVVRHTLRGDDDAVRYAQLFWSFAGMVAVMVLPLVAQSLKYIRRIFLFAMFVDGLHLERTINVIPSLDGFLRLERSNAEPQMEVVSSGALELMSLSLPASGGTGPSMRVSDGLNVYHRASFGSAYT